ncbi:hypothetical protein EDB81DRAFT_867930 [Dactylonectria macrodidyma]|uniref:NB-ARC domain-containing protein n=1 Tax=Dactylonectria macrodidyma TaxID=307937 RepID=A0A9P9FAI2_9HYPO|nr:hypothetical protein EDB81DRAFT_867930 [Dactylonectria macrodidyma]
MGNVAVVLFLLPFLLPGMGKANAASAVASLRSSYNNIKWALLVGICDAVPQVSGTEVLLGDVILSRYVVQYDFARQYSHKVMPKKTIEDTLGRPNKEIRVLNALLETRSSSNRLERKATQFLQQLQSKVAQSKHEAVYKYPGIAQDKLFKGSCRHKHQDPELCDTCGACSSDLSARGKRFRERQQLERQGHGTFPAPAMHIGGIASGDIVMKSSVHRDQVSKRDKVVAFEMEGAGVWDEMPCIVVKGHWQNFAAATAASVAKDILESYVQADHIKEQWPREPSSYLPFAKNDTFVGRQDVFNQVTELLFNKGATRVSLVGLGGIGKTQVALQVAFWTQKHMPDHSVFWIPALSKASFEQTCADLARSLGISITKNEDTKEALRTYLGSKKAAKWLFVLDTADDETIMYQSSETSRILDYIPKSNNGRLLLTTRSRKVAVKIAKNRVIELSPMSFDDAKGLLEKSLINAEQFNDDLVEKFLDKLTYLPLAIIPMAGYLALCEGTSQNMMELMSEGAQIHKTNPSAARLLSFITCVEPKAIPLSMMPSLGSEQEQTQAISTLRGYGFIHQRGGHGVFDMHGLVHLVMQSWSLKQGADTTAKNEWEHRELWWQYLPHALSIYWSHKAVDALRATELGYWVGRCLYSDGRVRESVKVLNHLAYHSNGQTKAAIALLQHVEHPNRLGSQHRLAQAYQANGQAREAMTLIRQSIELLQHVVSLEENLLPEEHPDRLASQQALAQAYETNGEVKRAVELLQHVVGIQEKSLAEDHPDRLDAQHALARAYHSNGRVKEAVQLLQHVVRVQEKSLTEDHPDRVGSQNVLRWLRRLNERNLAEQDL